MTGEKLLSRLLRMTGFKATWVDVRDNQGVLRVGVKPDKTGCRCPDCGRRGPIVNRLSECRIWEDVVVCGMRTLFFMRPVRLYARLMDGFRSASLGLSNAPG